MFVAFVSFPPAAKLQEGEWRGGEEGERKDSFLSHSLLRAAKVLSNLRDYGEKKRGNEASGLQTRTELIGGFCAVPGFLPALFSGERHTSAQY